MCDFNVNIFSFYYNDWEYFEWFRNPNEVNFNRIIKWKRLKRRNPPIYNNVWINNIFQTEYVDTRRLVTRAFLYHLNNPIEYPLIDRYVWWALQALQPEIQRTKYPYQWERDYINDYGPFFEGLYDDNLQNLNAPAIEGVNIQIVQRRIIDRALLEYGRTHNKLDNQNNP